MALIKNLTESLDTSHILCTLSYINRVWAPWVPLCKSGRWGKERKYSGCAAALPGAPACPSPASGTKVHQLHSFRPRRVWMAAVKVFKAKRKLNLLKIKPHLEHRKCVSGLSETENEHKPVCACLMTTFLWEAFLIKAFVLPKMTKKGRAQASKSRLLCQSAESEERGTLKHHSSLLVLPSQRHFLSGTMRQLTARTQELSR